MQPKPILVAEDEEHDVAMLKRLVQQCRVLNPLQIVSTGVEAIAYLKGEGVFADRVQYPLPAVVLLDLKMPRKGGLEVLQWLQTQPKPDFPVMILTGARDVQQMNIAYLLGARSFITKPLEKEEFLLSVCHLKGIMIEGESDTQMWEHFKSP
jgi:CheY-like chemotaxis protein